tara:strand:- start:6600 stop:7010 length:411 start_codon:yes stop_codon:yes gene_type:complete
MYKITAKKIANRVAISRGGSRIRRLPTLQVAGGACIKIAPGRSVVVTDAIYESNKQLLEELSSVLVVTSLREEVAPDPVAETIPPQPAPPEPIAEEPLPEPKEQEEPETVEEETVKEEPKPKPKRKRRSRAAKKEA